MRHEYYDLRSKGSYTLGAAALTLIVTAFLLIVAEFIHYSVARQAVVAATHRILRCVTTTDGGCTVQRDSSDEILDWHLQLQAERTLTWTDRYLYKGAVVEQNWQLVGPISELLVAPEPPLRWSTSSLPQRAYRGRANRFERRLLHLVASGSVEVKESHPQLAPTSEPNFPTFDERFERSVDRAAPSAWYPLFRNNDGTLGRAPLLFQSQRSSSVLVAGGSPSVISTTIIPVPTLPTTVPCLMPNGASCISPTGPHDVRRYASLAIKAFAELTPRQHGSGPTQVRWGDTAASPGLEVIVWSAAEVQEWHRSGLGLPAHRPICLGGRDWEAISASSPSHLNLWLRGPLGAHGGSHAICPSGRTQHSQLHVERGGAFQILGRLAARGRDVDASVRFDYIIDEYRMHEVTASRFEPYRCATSVPLRRDRSFGECPARELCPSDGALHIETCRTLTERIPGCWTEREARDNSELFAAPDISCPVEVVRPVCSDDTSPIEPPKCSLPPDRSVCGWQADPFPERLVTPTPATNCPLAVPSARQMLCSNTPRELVFRPSGDYGTLSHCDRVDAEIVRINAEAESLARRYSIALSRVQMNDLRWAPELVQHLAQWEPSPTTSGTSNIPDTSRREQLTRFPLIRPLLKRSDPHFLPPESEFAVPIQLRDAARDFTPQLISEAQRDIVGHFPFLHEPQVDISPDCSPTLLDSDRQLRAFAAIRVPALLDPSILFLSSESYVDSIVDRVEGGCGTTAVASTSPRCAPQQSVALEAEHCGPPKFLGSFPRSTHPHGPSQCHSSRNSVCFAAQHPSAASAHAPRIDQSQVYEIAYQELSRVLGTTLDRCQRESCLTIDIRNDQWPEVEVLLTLRHPVSTPLRSIFAQDSVVLTFTAKGRNELAPLSTEESLE